MFNLPNRYGEPHTPLDHFNPGAMTENQHDSRTVSVILTTFNMCAEAEKTLCGLRQQTYPSDLFEVIVSDDGSTDDIQHMLEHYTPYFSSLRFISQENRGFRLATVRNNGILAAHNEVIILLDGDVVPVPEFIASHMKVFSEIPSVATIGYYRYVDISHFTPYDILHDFSHVCRVPNYPSVSNRGLLEDKRLPEFAHFAQHPAPYNCFHGGNVAFKRSDALDVGLFSEDFNGNWGYEDLDFGYRLWKHGISLLPVSRALGLHQERAGTFSAKERKEQGHINLQKLLQRIPEFSEFRRQLKR